MKTQFLFACAAALTAAVCFSPAGAAAPIQPAPQQSACYTILQIPCGECPGQRSKYCTPDPSGLYTSCVESLSFCHDTSSCHQVTTTTGAACDG